MSAKRNTGKACAACKFQRRKCVPECPLAPYFSPEEEQQFLNVHRVFGVSNVLKILGKVDESMKHDAMKSMIFEANIRARNPVHGCLAVENRLKREILHLSQQLEITKNQRRFYQQLYQNRGFCNNANINGVPVKKALGPPNNNNDNIKQEPSEAAGAVDVYETFNHSSYRKVIDRKPAMILDYETKSLYDSEEADESRAELSMGQLHST